MKKKSIEESNYLNGFDGIPHDWQIKQLGDEIESLEAGVSVNSVDQQINKGDVCILKTSAVNNGIFIPSECKKIKKEDISRAKLNPRRNSIVISRMNTPDLVGECGYVEDDYPNLFLPDRLWQTKFYHNSKINAKWLNYLLNTTTYKLKVKSTATGTSNSMKNISKDAFFSISIPIPPLCEQLAIARLLELWDKAITNLQSTITNKQKQKKWLMQMLLTGKKRLKNYNKHWKGIRVKDAFDRVVRKNDENNKNIVTISAQRGFVRQNDFFSKIVASDILNNYFLVEKGEFCYNKSYSNGYPWGAIKRLSDFDKAVVTTLYICFRIKNEKLYSGDFFECFFEAGLLDNGLTKIAHEGGRAHGLLNVTPSDFFNLSITVPSFEEQTAIANILVNANKELIILYQKLEKLKQQKKGLMQQLLTGKKRLKIKSDL